MDGADETDEGSEDIIIAACDPGGHGIVIIEVFDA